MKLISLLVAFCFSLNVMAATGTVQELEKHLDDYHYSLSVEWDQKDKAIYDAKTTEFFSKIQKLIKEDGLSQEEIMTVLEKKVNNKSVIEAIQLKISLMPKASSPEELAKIIREASGNMYSQGASWNGDVLYTTAIILIVVGLIAYSVHWNATHECVAYENQYVCTTYNNCSGYSYDYGYNSCYNNYSTTCRYQDVCIQWAEKQ